MVSHHCRGEQLWIPGVSALVLHSSSVCLCCRQAWSHLLQCHWHLHEGLLIWAQSIWSSQTSLSIFSCAGRTQTRNLLLFKETLGFVGSKHVPAAPVPSSFLLHLGVAHRVQGSGPGFTQNEFCWFWLCPFPLCGTATLTVLGVALWAALLVQGRFWEEMIVISS